MIILERFINRTAILFVMSFELAFDNKYYYDTRFQIGELRPLDKPYELVLGERLSHQHLSLRGGLHLKRFGDIVQDFFAYFVNGSFFDVKDVEDRVRIPREGSFDYTMNGDVYVRRFGPFALLGELDSLDVSAVSPYGGLELSLTFALNNGHLSSSIAEAVQAEISTYCALGKQRERLLSAVNHSLREGHLKQFLWHGFEVIDGGKK